MDTPTGPTATITTKRRLAAALGLGLLIASGSWLLYRRNLPPSAPADLAVTRQISVSVPSDVRVELELDGDLFVNDPTKSQGEPGGGSYRQQYLGLKPGAYRVHVKGAPAPTQRSFWITVADAQAGERLVRGEIPAESGYAVVEITVE